MSGPKLQQTIDGTLGVIGVSVPFWLQWVQTIGGLALMAGSLMLVSIRLAISWREYKEKKK